MNATVSEAELKPVMDMRDRHVLFAPEQNVLYPLNDTISPPTADLMPLMARYARLAECEGTSIPPTSKGRSL